MADFNYNISLDVRVNQFLDGITLRRKKIGDDILGLKWKRVGDKIFSDIREDDMTEIINDQLSHALQTDLVFTPERWEQFKVKNLKVNNYVTVNGERYQPDTGSLYESIRKNIAGLTDTLFQTAVKSLQNGAIQMMATDTLSDLAINKLRYSFNTNSHVYAHIMQNVIRPETRNLLLNMQTDMEKELQVLLMSNLWNRVDFSYSLIPSKSSKFVVSILDENGNIDNGYFVGFLKRKIVLLNNNITCQEFSEYIKDTIITSKYFDKIFNNDEKEIYKLNRSQVLEKLSKRCEEIAKEIAQISLKHEKVQTRAKAKFPDDVEKQIKEKRREVSDILEEIEKMKVRNEIVYKSNQNYEEMKEKITFQSENVLLLFYRLLYGSIKRGLNITKNWKIEIVEADKYSKIVEKIILDGGMNDEGQPNAKWTYDFNENIFIVINNIDTYRFENCKWEGTKKDLPDKTNGSFTKNEYGAFELKVSSVLDRNKQALRRKIPKIKLFSVLLSKYKQLFYKADDKQTLENVLKNGEVEEPTFCLRIGIYDIWSKILKLGKDYEPIWEYKSKSNTFIIKHYDKGHKRIHEQTFEYTNYVWPEQPKGNVVEGKFILIDDEEIKLVYSDKDSKNHEIKNHEISLPVLLNIPNIKITGKSRLLVNSEYVNEQEIWFRPHRSSFSVLQDLALVKNVMQEDTTKSKSFNQLGKEKSWGLSEEEAKKMNNPNGEWLDYKKIETPWSLKLPSLSFVRNFGKSDKETSAKYTFRGKSSTGILRKRGSGIIEYENEIDNIHVQFTIAGTTPVPIKVSSKTLTPILVTPERDEIVAEIIEVVDTDETEVSVINTSKNNINKILIFNVLKGPKYKWKQSTCIKFTNSEKFQYPHKYVRNSVYIQEDESTYNPKLYEVLQLKQMDGSFIYFPNKTSDVYSKKFCFTLLPPTESSKETYGEFAVKLGTSSAPVLGPYLAQKYLAPPIKNAVSESADSAMNYLTENLIPSFFPTFKGTSSSMINTPYKSTSGDQGVTEEIRTDLFPEAKANIRLQLFSPTVTWHFRTVCQYMTFLLVLALHHSVRLSKDVLDRPKVSLDKALNVNQLKRNKKTIAHAIKSEISRLKENEILDVVDEIPENLLDIFRWLLSKNGGPGIVASFELSSHIFMKYINSYKELFNTIIREYSMEPQILSPNKSAHDDDDGYDQDANDNRDAIIRTLLTFAFK